MGVEERGGLPLVEGGCPVVIEELEVVMLDGSERLLLEAMVSCLSLLLLLLLLRFSCMYVCARVGVRACVRACVCVCDVWRAC